MNYVPLAGAVIGIFGAALNYQLGNTQATVFALASTIWALDCFMARTLEEE